MRVHKIACMVAANGTTTHAYAYEYCGGCVVFVTVSSSCAVYNIYVLCITFIRLHTMCATPCSRVVL